MPAGTDIITWAPRIGATGADRYAVPPDTPIHAGPADHYSDPPTVAEINAGWGVNQLIAEYNRLAALHDPTKYVVSEYAGNPPVLEYVAADAPITVAPYQTIYDYSNQFRNTYGLADYPYTAFPADWATSPRTRISAAMLQELRAALSYDFIGIMPWLADYPPGVLAMLYRRGYDHYYPTEGPYMSGGLRYGVVGQSVVRAPRSPYRPVYYNYRMYCSVRYPADLPAVAAAQLHTHYYRGGPELDFELRIYRAGAHLGLLTPAAWGHCDHLEASGMSHALCPDPGTINPVALPLTHTPNPGTDHTYIAVSAEDIAMNPPPLYVYPARSVSQTGQLTLLKAQLQAIDSATHVRVYVVGDEP